MLAPPVGVYRLNRNCDLARGLVFWLPGNTLIDALRHLALTASGGPTQVATDQGRAVNFVTASSQYLVTASSPITAVGFTMACWYNPVSVSNTRDLISIANSGNTTDYFNLQQNSTGAVRVRSADSTTQSSAVTATTATANTWQLAVGVIAATNSRAAYLHGIVLGLPAPGAAGTVGRRFPTRVRVPGQFVNEGEVADGGELASGGDCAVVDIYLGGRDVVRLAHVGQIGSTVHPRQGPK
jgi:hypothetical protein